MSEVISKIIKRSGEIVDFDQAKISQAVYRAALAVEVDDRHLAKKITDQTVLKLNQKLPKNLRLATAQSSINYKLVLNKKQIILRQ
jgi:transcriptional regulator NrdR family protein